MVADYQSSTSTLSYKSLGQFGEVCTHSMRPKPFWWQQLFSGVATPGHTQACAGVKFTGARVKIMWKAKVKDKLLAYAISFMWTWSEHTGKTKTMVFVAKNILRSDVRVINIFMAGACSSFPSRCMLRAHLMCPCCAHVTCSSWLRHCNSSLEYKPMSLKSVLDSYTTQKTAVAHLSSPQPVKFHCSHI